MYKPRYLRQLRGGDTSQQIFAFPDGLPGGWGSHRKIHIIAHSQGAMVARYLQYLLRIDYFSFQGRQSGKIERPIVDRSNYVASITTLNADLNGGPGHYFLDADEDTQHFHEWGPKATFIASGWTKIMKLWIVSQNLLSSNLTKDKAQENIRKVITVNEGGNKSKVYQLGQKLMVGHDFHAETLGLNRREKETVIEYLYRVYNDPIFSVTKREGMQDNSPSIYSVYNGRCKTHDHTYYFSSSTGSRCKLHEKTREILKEPTKCARTSIGFDLRAAEDVRLRGGPKWRGKRDQRHGITLFGMIC